MSRSFADPWTDDELGSNVCTNCTRLFCGPHERVTSKRLSGTLFGPHPNLQPESCRVCQIVQNVLPDDPQKPLTVEYEIVYRHVYLSFCHKDGKDGIIDLVAARETDMQGLQWSQDLPSNTLTRSSIKFLRSKMDECLSEHDHGQRTLNPRRWRPSRLLSIARDYTSRVYLEHGSLSEAEHYATLSHCWGGHQPMKLTLQSQPNLEAGVQLGDLPKTFRQAIRVCKDLGIHYIWIDSLCILQDNLEDWNSEAALMRNVYSYAYCNIAASGAPNCDAGLNFTRGSKSITPFMVKANWRFSADSAPSDSESSERYLILPPNRAVFDLERGPLNQRAWVLQERFLSNRIVHFTASQVFWECYNQRASEVFPTGLPNGADVFSISSQHHDLKQLLYRPPEARTRRWKRNVYVTWQGCVCAYTRCSLTVENDKLIAIAGIIQEVAEVSGLEFVCGLCKDFLIQDLLWRRLPHVRPRSGASFPTVWRAPTWSWAYTNFAVQSYTFARRAGCVNLRDTAVVEWLVDTTLPSGQLKLAIIALRGRVMHTILSRAAADVSFQLTCEAPVGQQTFSTSQRFGSVYLDDPYAPIPYDVKVVCMSLSTCEGRTQPDDPLVPMLEALILRRSKDVGRGQYERIGVLSMTDKGYEFFKEFETLEEATLVIV